MRNLIAIVLAASLAFGCSVLEEEQTTADTTGTGSTPTSTPNKLVPEKAIPLSSTTETCQDVCDGLVVYFPFFGDANDKSGNSHNASIDGPLFSEDRDQNLNSSLQFKAGDSVVVPDLLGENLDQNSISFVAVMKMDELGEKGTAAGIVAGLSSDDDWQGGFYLQYHFEMGGETNLWLDVRDGEALTQVFHNVPDPQKYNHIVGVIDQNAGELTLYVNGQKSTVSWDKQIQSGIRRLVFGGDNPSLIGTVDEFRLYNRAFTDADVLQLTGVDPSSGSGDGSGDGEITADNCMFNGQVVTHDSTTIGFATSMVPYSGTCQGVTLTCDNGVLSPFGYPFNSCTIAEPSNCMYNDNLLLHASAADGCYCDDGLLVGSTCTM